MNPFQIFLYDYDEEECWPKECPEHILPVALLECKYQTTDGSTRGGGNSAAIRKQSTLHTKSSRLPVAQPSSEPSSAMSQFRKSTTMQHELKSRLIGMRNPETVKSPTENQVRATAQIRQPTVVVLPSKTCTNSQPQVMVVPTKQGVSDVVPATKSSSTILAQKNRHTSAPKHAGGSQAPKRIKEYAIKATVSQDKCNIVPHDVPTYSKGQRNMCSQTQHSAKSKVPFRRRSGSTQGNCIPSTSHLQSDKVLHKSRECIPACKQGTSCRQFKDQFSSGKQAVITSQNPLHVKNRNFMEFIPLGKQKCLSRKDKRSISENSTVTQNNQRPKSPISALVSLLVENGMNTRIIHDTKTETPCVGDDNEHGSKLKAKDKQENKENIDGEDDKEKMYSEEKVKKKTLTEKVCAGAKNDNDSQDSDESMPGDGNEVTRSFSEKFNVTPVEYYLGDSASSVDTTSDDNAAQIDMSDSDDFSPDLDLGSIIPEGNGKNLRGQNRLQVNSHISGKSENCEGQTDCLARKELSAVADAGARKAVQPDGIRTEIEPANTTEDLHNETNLSKNITRDRVCDNIIDEGVQLEKVSEEAQADVRLMNDVENRSGQDNIFERIGAINPVPRDSRFSNSSMDSEDWDGMLDRFSRSLMDGDEDSQQIINLELSCHSDNESSTVSYTEEQDLNIDETSDDDSVDSLSEKPTSVIPTIREVQAQLALLKEQCAYLQKDKDEDDDNGDVDSTSHKITMEGI